jgi:hypothetical protein
MLVLFLPPAESTHTLPATCPIVLYAVVVPLQGTAGALADSLAGLNVGRPAGPLRGVAAPSGRHLVFDEEGKPKETPCSKLRQAPRHTYFDDEGRPIQAAPARPVWR